MQKEFDMKDLSPDLANSSKDMMKELQKLQQQDALQKDSKVGQEGGAKFDEKLSQVQLNETQQLQQIEKNQSLGSQSIKAAQSNQMGAVTQGHAHKVGGAEKAPHSVMGNVLKELMAGQNKMEGLMKTAMSGRPLDNQEMIGIQAGVYLFSQQMELASKTIEKATSGIKQMMNTQV